MAAGEDVYRGRVLEDELAVLVAGTVAVGDDRAQAGGFGGDQRMGVESMMSGASTDGIDSAAEPTVLSRPGTCVTSLLDVLEGSQRVARGASAAPSVAPSVAPSIAGDLNDDTRSEAGSVATLPPTDLTWEKDSHTGVNAKDAADPGEPAPGEPRTVTLKRLAEAAAAAHASVAVGGGGGSGAHFSAHGADSPAGSDSGIGSGVTATTTADGEHNRAVVATSPGDSTAGAHAPPPTHVDRPPSHIPPASVASASVASGHSPRSSHPTTPTRGGPRGSGLSARCVSTHHVAFHTHRLPLNYHPITTQLLTIHPPTNHQPRRSRRRREDLISRRQPRGSSHRIRCSRAPAAPPNGVGVQRWTWRVATAASQGRRRRVRPRGDTAGGEFLLI